MGNKPVKRVLVTFTAEQWKILETLKGELGQIRCRCSKKHNCHLANQQKFFSCSKKGSIFRG